MELYKVSGGYDGDNWFRYEVRGYTRGRYYQKRFLTEQAAQQFINQINQEGGA